MTCELSTYVVFRKQQHLTEYQSGFRKNRSTTDQLIRLYSWGFGSAWTCCVGLVWPGKSLWHDIEVWHTSWSAWSQHSRPTTWFYTYIFKRELFSCTCWVMLIWSIWSGNGSATRCCFICYFVHIEKKQYQIFSSWLQRFVVFRWFLHLFPLENVNSNRTSDSGVYQ